MSEEPKPSLFQRIKSRIRKSPRVEHGFNRMSKEAGFIPLYNIDDTEARRGELQLIWDAIQEERNDLFDPDHVDLLTPEKVREFKRRCNNRVFALFMSVGSPWYRGLDDRELARKVKAFLELWNRVGDHESFVDDVFMCAMQLVNLSWKALDVTNTPPYIIETKTIIQPESKRVKLSEEVQTY